MSIFEGDAFTLARLTSVVNEIKFRPGRIGELGLFEAQGVDTTSVMIERKGDQLILVPPTPRGGPGVTLATDHRVLNALKVPHFEINDSVMADSVQNVRAFGTETGLESVQAKVVERLKIGVDSMAVTEEHARMGAIKGVVTYADGSELDLFTEFEVTPEPVVEFDLSNGALPDGSLRRVCAGIVRRVTDLLGGVSMTGLHAFVGDDFFDDLLTHPEVRETFKGWNEAKILREGYVGPNRSSSYSFGIFEFGGIVWENYRGAVGTTSFIGADECHIFPIGVPGLFQTRYAPADYVETVNTVGRRLYSKQKPFPNDKGMSLDVQMNALSYATRPKVLIGGVRGSV